jgi:RNA polymerase sigma-70 factor (ECF subfamily)
MEASRSGEMRSGASAGGTLVDTFTAFVRETEPRLRRALAASLGTEVGIEATSEALAYGWEHWPRLHEMENPAGYLYRVGVRYGIRTTRRRRPRLPRPPESYEPWIEPKLPVALERLSEKQRVSIVLTRCCQWTYSETAEMLGVSVGTVEKHVERGLRKLREALTGGES